MKQFMDSLPNALVVYDAQWRITAFNQQAQRLLHHLGEVADLRLGEPITHYIPAIYLLKVPPQDVPFAGPVFDKYTAYRQAEDGSQLVSLHLASQVMESSEGNQVVLSLTDLSDNEVLQQKLHQQNTLMRTALDETPDVIVMKDWDGNFILVNQTVA